MSDAWWQDVADDRVRLLARLRALIGEHTGLKFPPERWNNIERAVELVGRQQGFAQARGWFEWFLAAPPTLAHLEPLISHLTIGETYFFRDKAFFAALRQTLLPRLIEQRRGGGRCLRLWSAGCSTGEEPYSIAIALQRLLPDWRSWHIALLASDINPQSLAKARAGEYDYWSFRGGLPQPGDSGFVSLGPKSFAVAPPVREMVRFVQLNLVDDQYPRAGFEAFDIIFCRNVLMYLDPPRARAVIDKLSAALVDGGWLILSAVESALAAVPQLEQQRIGDLILFQKRGSHIVGLPPVIRESPLLPAAVASHSLRDVSIAKPRSKPTPMRVAAADSDPPPAGGEPAVDVPALIERARRSADDGRLDEAAAYCAAAIAADKLNPDWTDLHASILLEQGVAAAAETALKRTLYLDQNRVLTHVKLANLLWGQSSRRGEGRRHFRTALELLEERVDDEPFADTDGMTVAQLRALIQTAIAHDVAGTYGKSA